MNELIDSNGYTYTIGGYFLAIELLKHLNLFEDEDNNIKDLKDMKALIDKANNVKRNNNYYRQYQIPSHL